MFSWPAQQVTRCRSKTFTENYLVATIFNPNLQNKKNIYHQYDWSVKKIKDLGRFNAQGMFRWILAMEKGKTQEIILTNIYRGIVNGIIRGHCELHDSINIYKIEAL